MKHAAAATAVQEHARAVDDLCAREGAASEFLVMREIACEPPVFGDADVGFEILLEALDATDIVGIDIDTVCTAPVSAKGAVEAIGEVLLEKNCRINTADDGRSVTTRVCPCELSQAASHASRSLIHAAGGRQSETDKYRGSWDLLVLVERPLRRMEHPHG